MLQRLAEGMHVCQSTTLCFDKGPKRHGAPSRYCALALLFIFLFQSSLRGSTILGIPATIPLSFLFHFPPRVFFIVD